jgi:hypothetical protein
MLAIIQSEKFCLLVCSLNINKQNKLHGLSPRANYTDRATALNINKLEYI